MNSAPRKKPDWKQWTGELAGGQFPLDEFLGAGRAGAVFTTRVSTGRAVIKLIPTANPRVLLDRWARVASFDTQTPHLARILQTGTWDKAGLTLAFVVMEYADEVLSDVLAERALSAEEMPEMLLPVAETLVFLHGRGLAHGALKASNILASGESLKISSDSIEPGDTREDLRNLAALVTQAMGRGSDIPAPFDAIVRGCGSAEDVLRHLRPRSVEPAKKPKRIAPTRYAILFAALLVVVLSAGSWWRNRTSVKPVQPSPPAPIASAGPSVTPVEPVVPKRVEKTAPVQEPRQRRRSVSAPEEVVAQALPEIPAKARRTVRGTATVIVDVVANGSGEVSEARLAQGSRYFGKLAVEAARKWRFTQSGEWSLRFEITRTDTKVFAAREETR